MRRIFIVFALISIILAPQAAFAAEKPATNAVDIYFFRGRGCPHCERERAFLDEMKKDYPLVNVKDYEVWYDEDNARFLARMLTAYNTRAQGMPMTFINKQVFIGFSNETRDALAKNIRECGVNACPSPIDAVKEGAEGTTGDETIKLPFAGAVSSKDAPLAVLTLIIAGLDSFNPCAFFVLLSLLGLLVHSRSRSRMFLTGGVFVFFSGLVYFVFMAAWLNLFLVMGRMGFITIIAAIVSLIIAGINIKDFFVFKKGVSLTIPESAKPGLFERMRHLTKAASPAAMLLGTAVLALAANSYELLCTAGFPMVFTRILTLKKLSMTAYYLYLALYNIVYVLPLLIIVVIYALTLGSKKLTERQGRLLKLLSGAMMLGLGAVLLINPALLNSIIVSIAILAGAGGITLIVAAVMKRWRGRKSRGNG